MYDLNIKNVALITAGTEIPVKYFVSDYVEHIGSKLTVELPTKSTGT